MLWMKTYFVYFSVRLGVIFISVLAFISLFVPSIVLFATGLKVITPILKLFNEDEDFGKYYLVEAVTKQVENDSNDFKVLLQLYLFAHMLASILSLYGALKLKKYFLLPMIFFELWRVIFWLIFHVLIMTVVKNRVDLGILIIATLAGGFLILFLGYNWAACVALYQIINLINSDRYKNLYGDDPFKPLIPKTYNSMVTQTVRVLITPTNHDLEKHKEPKNFAPQSQPIISIVPVNYLKNNLNSYEKGPQSQWPITTVNTPPTAQRYPLLFGANPTQKLYNRYDNNYEENYNNWQWSELMPGVSARNKRNIYLGANRNY